MRLPLPGAVASQGLERTEMHQARDTGVEEFRTSVPVCTVPGETALTRTPSATRSVAITQVSERIRTPRPLYAARCLVVGTLARARQPSPLLLDALRPTNGAFESWFTRPRATSWVSARWYDASVNRDAMKRSGLRRPFPRRLLKVVDRRSDRVANTP